MTPPQFGDGLGGDEEVGLENGGKVKEDIMPPVGVVDLSGTFSGAFKCSEDDSVGVVSAVDAAVGVTVTAGSLARVSVGGAWAFAVTETAAESTKAVLESV
jgi:hypothetical protein